MGAGKTSQDKDEKAANEGAYFLYATEIRGFP